MNLDLGNSELDQINLNIAAPFSETKTCHRKRSNVCNQCEFVSSNAHSLRMRLEIHSGDGANKCNQCDYASSQAGTLRRH